MKSSRFTVENLLYILALVLALMIRLLNLGAEHLSDAEAGWALQALDVARGMPGSLGSQPAYIFLTGSTFAVFGSSDFTARLWPALLGGCLVLLPFFFRRPLGRFAALVCAFGLALDPGLVAVSRQAGGPMMAVSFVLLALGLAYARLPVLAGIFCGLALLSGPAVVQGIVALALAGALILLLGRPARTDTEPMGAGFYDAGIPHSGVIEVYESHSGFLMPRSAWRTALAALAVTLFVAGTLFFRFPQGLGAWASTLPDYLSGWLASPQVPALRLLGGLLVYQPLASLFAVIGLFQVWTWRYGGNSGSDRIGSGRRLSLWLFFALALALLYPARQMGDLAWALVPLWGLAALGLAGSWSWVRENQLTSIAQGALIFVLLALVWLNLAGLSSAEPGDQAYVLRLGLLLGVLALAGLTTALVALGWSWGVARSGLLVGILVALGLLVLSNTAHVSQFHPVAREDIQELWGSTPPIGDADLLLGTIGDLSSWNTGLRDSIDLAVEIDSPSLRWALRDYLGAQFVSSTEAAAGAGSPDMTGIPSIMITHQNGQQPAQAASYRGQDFDWWLNPAWTGAFPPNFTRWFVFRQAPVQPERLILWARTDLFPGGELAPEEEPAPQGETLQELEVAR